MQMSRDTGEDRPYMAYDMDDHMDWNEIEFLSSMFCQPGEFNVQGDTVTIITRLDLSKEMGTSAESDTDSVKVPVKMVFTVGQGYPKIIPDIHIHSEHLNDENIFKIKSHVFENIGPDFLDMPMLLPLSGLIRDAARVELATVFRNRGPASDETDKEVDTVRRSSSENNDEEVASKRVRSGNDGAEGATSGARDSWSAVLHIDHMRSKNKYCKTLEKWALQLALTGRIVFLRRLILVLLQGCQENVKGFIVRLKTCTVDVDSKGHGCKEKMMKVLSEGESQSSYGLVSFTRCELTKESELRALISESGLDGHWENILPLLKQHH